MENLKYEYTRTIRFSLAGKELSELKPKPLTINKESALAEFYSDYGELLRNFEEALFYRNNGNIKIKNRIEIKKFWLRRYARDTFYQLPERDRDKGRGKFPVGLFANDFENWLKNNKTIYQKISEIRFGPKENKTKESDFRYLLRILQGDDYLGFILSLAQIGTLNDKDSDRAIAKLQSAAHKFELSLGNVKYFFAPDSSQGIEFARASFNFFAINKISKNFDQDIATQKQQMDEHYKLTDGQKIKLREVGFYEFNLSTEELYQKLKQFKSQQKKLFIEAIGKKQSLDGFPLFKTEPENIKKFIAETNAKKKVNIFEINGDFLNMFIFAIKYLNQ